MLDDLSRYECGHDALMSVISAARWQLWISWYSEPIRESIGLRIEEIKAQAFKSIPLLPSCELAMNR